MKLWPQTITGRTLVVLLVGIVISVAISSGHQVVERRALLATIGGWHGIERIADIIGKVEAASSEARADLVRSFETPDFRAVWSLQAKLPPMRLDWQGRQVRHALEEFVGDIAVDGLRMRMTGFRDAQRVVPHSRMGMHLKQMDRHTPLGMHERFERERKRFNRARPVVLVSYRLVDGSWLTVLTAQSPVRPVWGSRYFFPSILSLLVVVGVSVWAVRRATQPLGRFAHAAERLGLDVNAPPMNESGPREVRRAATAFNRMQRRLQAFVKDRTQMLAAISHDLRTPITRLRLRAEFIEDEEQRTKMLSDLDDMETMIAAILQFARDDVSGEAAVELDLAALVRELCDDAVRAGDDATCSAPETLIFTGRKLALKRMVSNVLDNAVRYGERARVVLMEQGDDVFLQISDDGPGIPDDMRERVFDPFVRVEGSRSRETGGTGLGLTAVKTIVRAHGGRIALANREGADEERGLDVRVWLPKSA